MNYEVLKLSNQLCFPVYALSRLITKEYQPHLDKLGITYPQYLVLLVLWENDEITVNEISNKLILNTNTTTPLLKRMEAQQLIERNRSKDDDRKVIVKLTEKGKALKDEAITIPEELANQILESKINIEELQNLKHKLDLLIDYLNNKP